MIQIAAGIVIQKDRHDLTIQYVHHHGATSDDVQLVPVTYMNQFLEFVRIADRANYGRLVRVAQGLADHCPDTGLEGTGMRPPARSAAAFDQCASLTVRIIVVGLIPKRFPFGVLLVGFTQHLRARNWTPELAP